MHILKSLISKIAIPIMLTATLLSTALSCAGTSKPQNSPSKKTHAKSTPSAASRLGTYASDIKDTVANRVTGTLDAISADTIQSLIKTGWTAGRLALFVGCIKQGLLYKQEAHSDNFGDGGHLDWTQKVGFGAHFIVAGIIAQNIYKSYETSIKNFFEEEDDEESDYEENEREESGKDKNSENK